MNTPIYPPRVQATILAYETGAAEAEEARCTATIPEIRAELEHDWWRALIDGDERDDLGWEPA